MRFRDRAAAGRLLAQRLQGRRLVRPLVLAIPRGGVLCGAALAEGLHSELDVVLVAKLRAPYQPEYAIGAVTEEGDIYLNPEAADVPGVTHEYLQQQRQQQMATIAQRSRLLRGVRPAAEVRGRSVIITDDGLATGSTAIAALQSLQRRGPQELILAVPVAPPDRLREVGRFCDETVCLHAPADFWAVGTYYDDFTPVDDQTAAEVLRQAQAIHDHRTSEAAGARQV